MLRTFYFILFSTFSFLSVSQTANLTILVSKIKFVEGSNIMVAIYNSEDSFFDSDQIYRKVEIPADSSVVRHTFVDLAKGVYAVTLYHGEDNDKEMDRKWYGPPKEGYAFSNNFTSPIRPASFKDASFELTNDKTINVVMVY